MNKQFLLKLLRLTQIKTIPIMVVEVDKPQRVKLRESQQNGKLLKEVYYWVLNKKRPESRQMKNRASKEL